MPATVRDERPDKSFTASGLGVATQTEMVVGASSEVVERVR